MDSLRLLNRGRLPLGSLNLSSPEAITQEQRELAVIISNPENVFVAHTSGLEFVPGANRRLLEFAGNAGYRREMLSVISDSYARPSLEVYRLVKQPI